MTQQRRHAARPTLAASPWLRWIAAFCVLMMAAAGTAEAVHIHGRWLPTKAHSVEQLAAAQDGTGEEHCPLCVAMHSTPAVSIDLGLEPLTVAAEVVTVPATREPVLLEHFARFSRPPPSRA